MVAAEKTDGPRQRWFSTDRELKALEKKPAAAGTRYIVWDKIQPYLGVRVTATGARSFVVIRRMPGERNPVTHVLGSYPALTLETARKDAVDALSAMVSGKHPKEIEAEQHRAAAKKRRDTFAAAAEAFFYDEKTKGLRFVGDTEAVLRREFLGQTWKHVKKKDGGREIEWQNGREPIWRDRPIVDITHRDVVERLDASTPGRQVRCAPRARRRPQVLRLVRGG